MSSLLGEDGRGYELAQKLESCGVWRTWFGDALYAIFVPFLSSSSAWESFMSTEEKKTKAQIVLQLRARALLFDKASVALFLQSPPSSSSAVSMLNPSYLQLHGDDVYFTLENSRDGVASSSALTKNQNKLGYGAGSRYGVLDLDYKSQRLRHEEFPETWYTQFIEKYRAQNPYTLSLSDQRLDRRSPEQMSAYLRLVQNNKRRRMPFKVDKVIGFQNSASDNISNMESNYIIDDVINSIDEDAAFFPETMFALNCVPDNALPPVLRTEENQKVEFRGVLDTLPQVMTARSSVMIERLGIRPDGGNQNHGKNGPIGNRASLSEEQALKQSQKVIVIMLRNVGFESATELPVETLAQLLSCHIHKLGGILRVLANNYRKQCSAIELIKMFLQSAKQCNLGTLVELVKDSSRNSVQQSQQLHAVPSQLQSQIQAQHLNPIRQTQQIPRQMHSQMQQMVHSQNISFQQQQQWERMRKRHPSVRAATDMDRDRPLVQVKLENPSDLPLDGNVFNNMNPRHPQIQFRQQPVPPMPNANTQSSNQFRQMASLQVPQVQSPNMGITRAPPMKVEGFQELMGGDTSLKQDSDGNKLTSPSK